MKTTDQIAYRDGFIYQLTRGYRIQVGIFPEEDILTEWLGLTTDGFLIIKTGYAWDGPSGPAIDTKSAMRGSLVHDALYQLMREGLLDREKYRNDADKLYRRLCVEDGMWRIRAWWHYQGVNMAAKSAAKASAIKTIKYAPLLALVVLLSACAERAALIDSAATVFDTSVMDAELVICKGPAGAIARRYWQDPIMASAWAQICFGNRHQMPWLPKKIEAAPEEDDAET